jgi:hypothetical protein
MIRRRFAIENQDSDRPKPNVLKQQGLFRHAAEHFCFRCAWDLRSKP